MCHFKNTTSLVAALVTRVLPQNKKSEDETSTCPSTFCRYSVVGNSMRTGRAMRAATHNEV